MKKGDLLYSLQIKSKPEPKKNRAVARGKVLSISAKPGDEVKKGKTPILVLEQKKGALP